MSDLCEHCGMCCKLIPVNLQAKTILRDGIQPLDENFFEQLAPLTVEEAQNINGIYVDNVLKNFPEASFYRCKYLAPSNLCSKLNIPELCKNFPSHPFALIPEDCGYIGENFVKKEEIKQKIRRYKEEIIDYQTLIQTDEKNSRGYIKIIESLERFIKKYQIYGSEEW